MIPYRRPLALAALIAVTLLPQMQEAPPASEAAAAVASAPKKEDVATMEGILGALYDVISGPAGQKRDWGRFHSLMAKGARLMAVQPTRGGGPSQLVTMTPQDYVERSGPWLVRSGFFEQEIARRRVDRFGGVVHVMSTYAARRKAEDEKPFMRGVNSIQLFHDGARWWIVSIFWEAETPTNPLPAHYLPEKTKGR